MKLFSRISDTLARATRSYWRGALIVLTLVGSLALGVGVALAAPMLQAEPANPLAVVLDFIGGLGSALLPYAGWAAFALFSVDVLKRTGRIQDGQAGDAQAVINLLGAAGLYALRRFAPDVNPADVDTAFKEIALVGTAIVGLVGQIGATKLFYWITSKAGATFSFGSRPRGPQA
jgi:hypothetical protein